MFINFSLHKETANAQFFKTVYMVAQKEVYVPLIMEFFDCPVIVNREWIKTKANNKIITLIVNDITEALNVRLDEGEMYSAVGIPKLEIQGASGRMQRSCCLLNSAIYLMNASSTTL